MNIYRFLLIRLLLIMTAVLCAKLIFGKELRSRIVVIDTGIPKLKAAKKYLCKDGNEDLTGFGIKDVNGHATNIVGIIAKNINTKTHCITMLKFFDNDKTNRTISYIEVVIKYSNALLKLKPEYLNMSFGGASNFPFEYNVLKYLADNGTSIFIAAGNEGKNYNHAECDQYPACYFKGYPNIYVVSDSEVPFSNKGGPVNTNSCSVSMVGLFGPTMTGTSQATAYALSRHYFVRYRLNK